MMAELARLNGDVDWQRLCIFRDYLARNVCLASPLLLSVCRPDELDEAFWRLKPDTNWPRRGRIQTMIRGPAGRSSRHGPVRLNIIDPYTGERFQIMDQVALRVSPWSAHMSLKMGELIIRTHDAGGSLSIPRILTSEECEALLGATLDAVLRHPMLETRQYPIVGVRLAVRFKRSVVEFVVPPEEWRVPWARPWEIPF